MFNLQIIIIILLLIILSILIYHVFFNKSIICYDKKTQKKFHGTSPQSPGSEDNDVTSWMGNNDWVLMFKLGNGGDNCNKHEGIYSCNYLYASSTEPKLKLINDHTVDAENLSNPAYQFYLTTKNNKNVSWNDQGGEGCDGATGAAHDKGALVYNNSVTEGVYMQHSNPHWGFFDQGFLNSCNDSEWSPGSLSHCVAKKRPIHSGLQTGLAQHLLFVKIPSAKYLKTMAKLMTNANLCIIEGSFPDFNGCDSDCPTDKDYMNEKVGNVNIISKPRGRRGMDVWSHLKDTECGEGGIHVYSFCSNPPCPDSEDYSHWKRDHPNPKGEGEEKWEKQKDEALARAKISVSDIIDVTNLHKNNDSSINMGCVDPDFSPFHSNHSKIGVCNNNSDVLIIGGNNHSISSQGPRGGLFVVINNPTLASTLRCLFKK